MDSAGQALCRARTMRSAGNALFTHLEGGRACRPLIATNGPSANRRRGYDVCVLPIWSSVTREARGGGCRSVTAFRDFLDLARRPGKPRSTGLTHVLDKGLSLATLDSLVETVGAYVDIIKLGWGTAYVTHGIRAKVAVCEENGIVVCPGGTLFEIAAHQGRIGDYLTWLGEIGVTHVEVSNGALGMPAEDKQRHVRQIVGAGFVVFSEVGSKDPDRAVVASEWADEMLADLDCGAALVIAEGRESGTVGLYDAAGRPNAELIDEVIKRVPQERVLFESPRKDQQAWLIRRFGAEVNLGNVPPDDILNLETLRRGLRADTVALLDEARRPHAATPRPEPPAWPPVMH
jgi:phosphosulfolactate synthase